MTAVARLVLRRAYRAASGNTAVRPVVLLIGGYGPKLSRIATLFRRYGTDCVAVPPQVARRGADAVVEMLDAYGCAAWCVIPLVDSTVAVADMLNTRLRGPANDPDTAQSRRDKYEMQQAVRRAGLAAPAQCVAAHVDDTVLFVESLCGRPVVVKPRDSSGGDGVRLCASPDDVREAFSAALGRTNIEQGPNADLVVMEAIEGEEWVVNTVSLNGIHKVTDAWQGPPKIQLATAEGPAQFVYNVQFLARDTERKLAVVEFTLAVLDAVGLRNGAAHTELVWAERPCLLEVNARPAGGLPRTPHPPDQLEALMWSVNDPERFRALPTVASATTGAAVVFLRAPRDSWISSAALEELTGLGTFERFERGLFGLCRPFKAHRVEMTTGLFSSPGCIVLHGDHEAVEADVERIRLIEASGAYIDSPDAPPPTSDLESTMAS